MTKSVPDSKLAVLAGVTPLFVSLSCCVVVPFAAAGDQPITHMLEETGVGFYAIALSVPFAAVLAAVLVALGATGRRVPSAFAVFVATLPWQVGLASTRYSFSIVESAAEFADPSMRASLIAQGISESMNAHVLGASASAGLLVGVAVGLAIAAFAQRAPNRSVLGIATALLAVPMLAEAGWLLTQQLVTSLVITLVGLAAVVVSALAPAAVGADAPRFRSGALAATALVAAALAFAAAATATETAAERTVFSALAFASYADRLSIVAAAAYELAPFGFVSSWGSAVAILPVAAVAAFAIVKGKPSVGRIAGAIAVVAVVAMALALDAVVMASASEIGSGRLAWEEIEGFEASFVAAGEDPSWLTHAVVTTDRLIATNGTEAALDARAELVTTLRTLRSMEPPQGLDPVEPPLQLDPAMPPVLPPDSNVALAIDRRVSGAALRSLFEAAEESGAYTIEIVGASMRAEPAEVAIVEERLPLIAGLLIQPASVSVRLPIAVPAAHVESDPLVWHATISSAVELALAARPGATPPTRTLREASSWDVPEEERLGGNLVYLLLPPGATIEDVVRAASLVHAHDGQAQIVFDRFPEAASQPVPGTEVLGALADPGSAGILGLLRGTAVGEVPGTAAVDPAGTVPPAPGSRDRESIRRVIRSHHRAAQRCYEEQLLQDPSAGGNITVQINIAASGEVINASTISSTFGSPAMEECLLQSVRSYRFPAASGRTVVSYPFAFTPA